MPKAESCITAGSDGGACIRRWRKGRRETTMPAHPLRLEGVEFTDPDHWRWVLQENSGAFVADHSVTLDRADPRYPAVLDLPGYLNRYAAPDRREADEHRLIAELGIW